MPQTKMEMADYRSCHSSKRWRRVGKWDAAAAEVIYDTYVTVVF